MNKIHLVKSTRMDDSYFYMTVDGQQYRIRWSKCSPSLAKATPAQRERYEVSPSGYGIHWPEIDEDLAITPLLRHAELLASVARQTGQRASALQHAAKKAA